MVEPLPKIELLNRIHPINWHGYGKLGNPIFLDRMGLSDPNVGFPAFTHEEMHIHHAWVLERGRQLEEEQSVKLGRRLEGSIQLVDLKGFSRVHLDKRLLSLLKEFVYIEQRFYPGLLYKFILVNVPWLFSVFWKLVQLWLDDVTKSKFIILGEDYQEKLAEYIDLDQLPTYLGGNCSRCGGCCLPFGDEVKLSVTSPFSHEKEHQLDLEIDKMILEEQETQLKNDTELRP